jgi:hypothetical protein
MRCQGGLANQPPLFLRQTMSHKFVNVSASAGEPFNIPLAARGAASGDLDNDGDTDFVIKTLNGAPGRSAQQRNEESLDRIKPAGKKVEPPGSRRSRVGR